MKVNNIKDVLDAFEKKFEKHDSGCAHVYWSCDCSLSSRASVYNPAELVLSTKQFLIDAIKASQECVVVKKLPPMKPDGKYPERGVEAHNNVVDGYGHARTQQLKNIATFHKEEER